jgi:hypothetical protein
MPEFARWDRVALQHERAYISKTMVSAAGFIDDHTRAGLLHDLTDIDYCLSQLPLEDSPSPLEKK